MEPMIFTISRDGSVISFPIQTSGPGTCHRVIASVMNQMGSMLGDSILGWIVFILVFVIGHIFNLLINLLGAYVHTCRLQYVEFFGKFFEGGGKEFHPFRENTKYVDIKED